MARLIYALNQTLDGYVDHDAVEPDPVLFRHFIEDVLAQSASIYGRRMYEVMRYWDDDRPEWDDDEREYARAWRAMHKWVASRTLKEVGPNAEIARDPVVLARELKDSLDGTIEVAGPKLAATLSDARLIDEYRIYIHPAVAGGGKPFFARTPPPLSLVASERIGRDAIRLTYVPA